MFSVQETLAGYLHWDMDSSKPWPILHQALKLQIVGADQVYFQLCWDVSEDFISIFILHLVKAGFPMKE